MKIEHNITRNGCTLSGYITNTIFEEGEKRGDNIKLYTSDWNFNIKSSAVPELEYELFVWWTSEDDDNKLVSATYGTEELAQRILDYINKFTIQPEPKKDEFVQGEIVLAYDDKSCDRNSKSMVIYVATVPERNDYKYLTYSRPDYIESWRYIEKYIPEPVVPTEPEVVPPLSNEEIKLFREMIKNK